MLIYEINQLIRSKDKQIKDLEDENQQLKEEVRYFDKKSTRLMYNIEELEKENKELKKILEVERCDADCYIDSLKQELQDANDHIEELNKIIETLKDIITEYESELLEEQK